MAFFEAQRNKIFEMLTFLSFKLSADRQEKQPQIQECWDDPEWRIKIHTRSTAHLLISVEMGEESAGQLLFLCEVFVK